ncbi:MAG: class I SAM-dependent methyltransferase [Planctomycetaceae bacterium]
MSPARPLGDGSGRLRFDRRNRHYKGKVTAWLVEAAERAKGKAKVISIDPHIFGTWEEYQGTVQKFELENRGLKIHKEFSHDLGQKWEEPISMLLVDGSHEYEDVVADIEDFVPHVLPSGYVVFDDARGEVYPGVARAINERMRNRNEFEEVGMIKNFAVFRKKAA